MSKQFIQQSQLLTQYKLQFLKNFYKGYLNNFSVPQHWGALLLGSHQHWHFVSLLR